ncbi:MAG: hypothetical protein IID17_13905 [Nitrospinae bacterium]|nr:hypothetical protein [Nitrospinota bacterium]
MLDGKQVHLNDYRGKYLLINAVEVTEVFNTSGDEVKTPKVSSLDPARSIAFNPFEPKPILPQSGILVLILLSFSAGILSFLSPCTLPILPAYFAVTAQAGRARMSMMSVAFFCGLATRHHEQHHASSPMR